ncbi:hypothetical protein [Alteribacillus bidgolensis]|nr:hypothetical protein [Alteribacillus bidgolensis]
MMKKTTLSSSLKNENLINGLSGWKIIEMPGHAKTHVSMLREEDGCFIGGDHILGHVSSNAIIEAPYPGEKNRSRSLLQYREALEKCTHLPIDKVHPGHGETVINVNDLINSRLKDQEARAEQLLNLLKKHGTKDCYQICALFFKEVVDIQPDLTMSEILGHLDLLEEKNLLSVTVQKNKLYYSA